MGEKTVVDDSPYFAFCPFNGRQINKLSITYSIEIDSDAIMKFSLLNTLLSEIEITETTSQSQYESIVEKAINECKSNKIEKVVVGGLRNISISEIDVFDWYRACVLIPNSYCYLLKIRNEVWLGASPELLFRLQNRHFETMALAGTRFETQTSWGQKEIDEHQIVGEYIADLLHQNGFKKIAQHQAVNKNLGTIQHLCTHISAEWPVNLHSDDLVEKMHPTPALAGFPKEKSIAFIGENELFDRELFGGYLGIVNTHKSEFFVNIRCMKIGRNVLNLYAGAGINKDSNPTAEWEEINRKMEVMGNLIATNPQN
ncbi:MAG: chorismate-binding protein [Flavobacteriales bacterium]|nr:chorismate-binding protein [Flavobacteriales bacterium]